MLTWHRSRLSPHRSTVLVWSTTDRSVQRILLRRPIGVSRLRFGTSPSHPLATLTGRNGSMIQALSPAQPAGTTKLGVVFSPNAAEEDYIGGLNFTYYDEVGLQSPPTPPPPALLTAPC